MRDFKDFRDLPAAPRVTPAASLWVMFAVVVVAMSALVWTNPGPEKEASAQRLQRCWPQCPPAGPAQGADAKPSATQARDKPPARPGSHSSV